MTIITKLCLSNLFVLVAYFIPVILAVMNGWECPKWFDRLAAFHLLVTLISVLVWLLWLVWR